jgi:hypothetical protein
VQPLIELGSQQHLPPAHQNSISGNSHSNEEHIFWYFASLIDPEAHSCKRIPTAAKLNALQNQNSKESEITWQSYVHSHSSLDFSSKMPHAKKI